MNHYVAELLKRHHDKKRLEDDLDLLISSSSYEDYLFHSELLNSDAPRSIIKINLEDLKNG